MDLYICRHGETEWSLSEQHTSYSDIPLTENGERQALLLGKRLKQIDFDKIYSSPRQRALKTCHLAGLEPLIDPDLVEWNYGEYEGLKRDEIEKREPNWSLFQQGAPNGESPKEVGARADRFLRKLAKRNGSVAVFSHGHFSRVLAARFLQFDVELGRYFLLNVASLSLLSYERKQPIIAFWNDTDYLKVSL